MTKQEEREEARMRILRDLKRKVRPHRPAKKVLEMAIASAEDRVEMLGEKKVEQEWEVEYLKGLSASELEPDDEG